MGHRATKCLTHQPRDNPTEANLALWFREDCSWSPITYKDLVPISSRGVASHDGCMHYFVKADKRDQPPDFTRSIFSFNIVTRRWFVAGPRAQEALFKLVGT